ncbi:hypothetical protein AVEN_103078-1 [Araneus ventricosus]|uniref:Uncharacterized protein n=1 Tax=Araneus ventricosus TaxID=182803 RepID=A0A4Y2B8B6_ARAVE|nr:hypothetical protein AVEN_103078-1 [Araneus ventricosus]
MIILKSNTGRVSLRRSSQSKKRAVNNAQKGYTVEEGDFPERPVTRSGSESKLITMKVEVQKRKIVAIAVFDNGLFHKTYQFVLLSWKESEKHSVEYLSYFGTFRKYCKANWRPRWPGGKALTSGPVGSRLETRFHRRIVVHADLVLVKSVGVKCPPQMLNHDHDPSPPIHPLGLESARMAGVGVVRKLEKGVPARVSFVSSDLVSK